MLYIIPHYLTSYNSLSMMIFLRKLQMFKTIPEEYMDNTIRIFTTENGPTNNLVKLMSLTK